MIKRAVYQWWRGSTVNPISSLTLGSASGVLTPSYTYTGTEANREPIIESIYLSGTSGIGNDITIDMTFINPTIYSDGAHRVQVYRASDMLGTGLTLVSTLTSFTTVGGAKRFTYTQVNADAGNQLLFVGRAAVNGGSNQFSTLFDSDYFDVVSPLSVFDVRSDRAADATHTGDGTNVTAWNGMTVEGTPTWDATKGGVQVAEGDGFQFTKVAMPMPFEVMLQIEFETVNSTNWIQTLAANNGFRTNGSRLLNAFGVDTGTVPTGKTVIRLGLASGTDNSYVSFDNGAKTTFTATPSVGAGDGHFGRRSTSGNGFVGWLYDQHLANRLLTDTEATNAYNFIS